MKILQKSNLSKHDRIPNDALISFGKYGNTGWYLTLKLPIPIPATRPQYGSLDLVRGWYYPLIRIGNDCSRLRFDWFLVLVKEKERIYRESWGLSLKDN